MAEKPRLLIVEDELDLQDMITTYFGAQNYEVEGVAWASEALALVDEVHFDLIVLDIHLPDGDGFDLCRKLRDNRRTKDTPIIFLTEKRERSAKLQGLELGVVDYITKPFDLQELGLRIRNTIQRAAAPLPSNRVTDLPEGRIVDEKLLELLNAAERPWALLAFSVPSLGKFREHYGFVQADDVLRALALIVRNAVKEHGKEGDFVGHLGEQELVVITQPETHEAIYNRVMQRIEQSREYFYPFKDRERLKKAEEEKHLEFTGIRLPKPHPLPADLVALKEALGKPRPKPVTGRLDDTLSRRPEPAPQAPSAQATPAAPAAEAPAAPPVAPAAEAPAAAADSAVMPDVPVETTPATPADAPQTPPDSQDE
jgi:CheY-like chemotaxis protein